MKHDHGLSKQAVAAASLIRALGDEVNDGELVHDTVEGETDFFEAVERALDEIAECEIVAAGIKEMQATLTKRLSRTNGRAERLRGLIDQSFQIAEIKSHKFPTATITTKNTPPKLIITDESSIPSRFFTPKPPALDRASLLKEAKQGSIAGVEMSNGGTTIQIRRG